MFFDESLARRLEANYRWFFTELASASRGPDPFLDLGYTVAFFAGADSPYTQALGRFGNDDLDTIGKFYEGRTAHWEALISPFAGPDVLQRVLDRGAKAERWESQLFRPTALALPAREEIPELRIVEVEMEQREVWSSLCAQAYFGEESTGAARDFKGLMRRAEHMRQFLALWKEEPVGIASLTVGLGIGFLGDMRTLPEFRGRGIQTALIHRRLEAAQADSDFVMVGTAPGSGSYRNVARMGFQIAYSQLSLRVPTA